MKTKLLDTINSPKDLKKLEIKDLEKLGAELREFIITNVNKTGGHLGPSLGVIELTIALHKVFDTLNDKIIWDVGHQGYAHKILTGRRDVFHTNRQLKGISGFIKPSESPHDAFGVGHASTSISAGCGFVSAFDLKNANDSQVISVIGDGAITGGLAYEGLNNGGALKKKFLVILNDNHMSISKNVGAMSSYITSILTDPTFNKIKDEIWDFTGKFSLGKSFRKVVSDVNKSVKAFVSPGLLFEKLGFNYIGPINGHNLDNLVKVLEHVKNDVSGPVFLHIITQKGKGFKPAEDDFDQKYHGVSPGILENGDGITVAPKKIVVKESAKVKKLPKYQDVFGKAICKIAEKNDKILAVTAAMKTGTGLDEFAEKFPNRFFDVGIAEGHAVTFSAALSLEGFRPVIAIYSTFFQRALDHIIHDCSIQKLNVILAIDRAGLVGDDGPTHHGVFDFSYLRFIPNIVLMAPKDENELSDMLYTASENDGIFAIRYPRGTGMGTEINENFTKLTIGIGEQIIDGKGDIAILAVGKMVDQSLKVAEKLLSENNTSASVYNMRYIKPIDREILLEVYNNYKYIITIEENSIVGGFGSGVLEELNKMNIYDAKVKVIGIPDNYVEHGTVDELYKIIKLDVDGIIEQIKSFTYEFRDRSKDVYPTEPLPLYPEK